MNFNREHEMRDIDAIKNKCTCYMFYDAVLVMDDGRMVNGIIENVDDDNVRMLVGEDVQVDEDNIMNNAMNNMTRQPRPGFNKYRRYERRNFPIGRINRVGLLPYPLVPPIYPPYPVYPYSPIFPY